MAEIRWKSQEEIDREEREKEILEQVSDISSRVKSLEDTILLLMME